ncbi:unnamed protein product [Closterium sp. Naga37s-1]|nr:unnamed protein product [Closterium sp. Naga37s-1]
MIGATCAAQATTRRLETRNHECYRRHQQESGLRVARKRGVTKGQERGSTKVLLARRGVSHLSPPPTSLPLRPPNSTSPPLSLPHFLPPLFSLPPPTLSRLLAVFENSQKHPLPPARRLQNNAEDAVLLRHALRAGTNQWGALEKGGREAPPLPPFPPPIPPLLFPPITPHPPSGGPVLLRHALRAGTKQWGALEKSGRDSPFSTRRVTLPPPPPVPALFTFPLSQEDAVLLRHALSAGTKQWGEDALLLRHALRAGTKQWGALEKSNFFPPASPFTFPPHRRMRCWCVTPFVRARSSGARWRRAGGYPCATTRHAATASSSSKSEPHRSQPRNRVTFRKLCAATSSPLPSPLAPPASPLSPLPSRLSPLASPLSPPPSRLPPRASPLAPLASRLERFLLSTLIVSMLTSLHACLKFVEIHRKWHQSSATPDPQFWAQVQQEEQGGGGGAGGKASRKCSGDGATGGSSSTGRGTGRGSPPYDLGSRRAGSSTREGKKAASGQEPMTFGHLSLEACDWLFLGKGEAREWAELEEGGGSDAGEGRGGEGEERERGGGGEEEKRKRRREGGGIGGEESGGGNGVGGGGRGGGGGGKPGSLKEESRISVGHGADSMASGGGRGAGGRDSGHDAKPEIKEIFKG